jgi:hypothetical protein
LHEKLSMQRQCQAALDEKRVLEEQVMKLQHRVNALEMGQAADDHGRRIKNAYMVMKRLVSKELSMGFNTWKQKAFPCVMLVESEESKLIKVQGHRSAQENAMRVLRRWFSRPLAEAFQHMRWYAFIYTRKVDELKYKKSVVRKTMLRLLNQQIFSAFNQWTCMCKAMQEEEDKTRRVRGRIKGAFNRMYFDRIRLGWKRWCQLIRNIKLQEKTVKRIIDMAMSGLVGDLASAFRRWHDVVSLYREDTLSKKLLEVQRLQDMANMASTQTYKQMIGVLLKFMVGRTFMRLTIKAWLRWSAFTTMHRQRELELASQNQMLDLQARMNVSEVEVEAREAAAKEKYDRDLAYMRLQGEEAEARWLQEQYEKNLQKKFILNLLNAALRPPFNQWRDACRTLAEEERTMKVRIKRARRVVVSWIHKEMRPGFTAWVAFVSAVREEEATKVGMVKTARGVIQRWFRKELAWGWQKWIDAYEGEDENSKKMRRAVRDMCQRKLRAGWIKWIEVLRMAQLWELRAVRLLQPILKRSVDYLRISHTFMKWQKNLSIVKRQRKVISRLLHAWLFKGFRKWKEVNAADRMGRMVIRAVCRRMISLADMSMQKAFALWLAYGQSVEADEIARKSRVQRAKVAILGWLHRELLGPFTLWKRAWQEDKRSDAAHQHSVRVARTVIQRWIKGELAWGFQGWYKATVARNKECVEVHAATRLRLLNMKARGMSADKLGRVATGWERRRKVRAFQLIRKKAFAEGRTATMAAKVFRMWSTVKQRLLTDGFSRWRLRCLTLGLEEECESRAKTASIFGLIMTDKLRLSTLKRKVFRAWRDFVRPAERMANGKIALGLSDMTLIASHLCRTAQDGTVLQFLSTASSALKYGLSINPLSGDFARKPKYSRNTPVAQGTSRLTAVVYMYLAGKGGSEGGNERGYGELRRAGRADGGPLDESDLGLSASPNKSSDGRGGGNFSLDLDLSATVGDGGGGRSSGGSRFRDNAVAGTEPALFSAEDTRPSPMEVVQGKRSTHHARRILLNDGLVGRCAASGQVKLLMRSKGGSGYSNLYRTNYSESEFDAELAGRGRGRSSSPGNGGVGGSNRSHSPGSSKVRFAQGTSGTSGTPPPPPGRAPRTATERRTSLSQSPPPPSSRRDAAGRRVQPASNPHSKFVWDSDADGGLSAAERARLGLSGRGSRQEIQGEDKDMQLIAAALPLWWKGQLVGVVSFECESWMEGIESPEEQAYGIYELNRSLYYNSRDATKRSAFGPLSRIHLNTLSGLVGQSRSQGGCGGGGGGGGSGGSPAYPLTHPSSPGPWQSNDGGFTEEGDGLIDGLFDEVAATNSSDVWNWSYVQMCLLFGMQEHQVAMTRTLVDPISASLTFLKAYHSMEDGLGRAQEGTADVTLSSIFRISGTAERARLQQLLAEKEALHRDDSGELDQLKNRIQHLEKSRMKHFEASQATNKSYTHASAEVKRLSTELTRYKNMVTGLQRQQSEVDAIHASLKEVTATVLSEPAESHLPIVAEEDEDDEIQQPQEQQQQPSVSQRSVPPTYRPASSVGKGGKAAKKGYRDSISLLYGKDSISDLYGGG